MQIMNISKYVKRLLFPVKKVKKNPNLSECCNVEMNTHNGIPFCWECGTEHDPVYTYAQPKNRKKADSPKVKSYVILFQKMFPNEKIIRKEVVKFLDESFVGLKEMGYTKKFPLVKDILYTIIELSGRNDLLKKLKTSTKNFKEDINHILNYGEKINKMREKKSMRGEDVVLSNFFFGNGVTNFKVLQWYKSVTKNQKKNDKPEIKVDASSEHENDESEPEEDPTPTDEVNEKYLLYNNNLENKPEIEVNENLTDDEEW